jgi:nucleotide-binding universal stress UspA family protein
MPLANYHNILVPIDGSANALRALDFAAALAQAAGLQLLLYVTPRSPIEMMKIMGYPAAAQRDAESTDLEFEQASQDMAEQVFATARARLPEDLTVRQIMQPGDAAQVILEQADKLGNAVIVMGNRGLSGMREMLMGGVSNKVLHHAHCPVTIVR